MSEETDLLMHVFCQMLWGPTDDGKEKRDRGEKPPWWRDPSHDAAIQSHYIKWKAGETVDKDSGEHPLVHAAWRCLAIAYQETFGEVDPALLPTIDKEVDAEPYPEPEDDPAYGTHPGTEDMTHVERERLMSIPPVTQGPDLVTSEYEDY